LGTATEPTCQTFTLSFLWLVIKKLSLIRNKKPLSPTAATQTLNAVVLRQ
jgi:hypothetical protein